MRPLRHSCLGLVRKAYVDLLGQRGGNVIGLSLRSLRSGSVEKDRTAVEAAAAIISRYDPHGWDRIRSNLRMILVSEALGPEFWPSVGACVLDSRSIEEMHPMQLASTIVHEAAHARIWRLFPVYSAQYALRIECACRRAELNFLERVPDSAWLSSALRGPVSRLGASDEKTERRVEQLIRLGAHRSVIAAYRCIRRIRSDA